jgi:hypothetical protein
VSVITEGVGNALSVAPGLVPGIHAVKRQLALQGLDGFLREPPSVYTTAWMAGTSPAMTTLGIDDAANKRPPEFDSLILPRRLTNA